jgi:hypothetical protein
MQQRDGRWVFVDLVGKGKRIRTVPIPPFVKVATDAWTAAAGLSEGPLFRRVRRRKYPERTPDLNLLMERGELNLRRFISTGAWPVGRAALFGAVKFLSHQLAIPGENGIVFGDVRLAAVLSVLNACLFPQGWPARRRRAASLAADASSKCGSRPPRTHSAAVVPG